MKNTLKIGFLALAIGFFAASCGGSTTPATDSTAVAPAVDSAAVTPAPADSAVAPVDSAATAPADSAK
ncbi:hypothetical protein LX64_03970 [Chitinophaga skermanii]|uniref:Uncharacterized protein n=1 Tax=Chitinophaga skermanii TaxID=331697 RepID=A0A327Q8Y0_9BACT|nr:hypothetical protein [Chitinophaga skermanii]RAJ00268.1 hypothetical protein LX64_03970 [Chitinophaga skermanii]